LQAREKWGLAHTWEKGGCVFVNRLVELAIACGGHGRVRRRWRLRQEASDRYRRDISHWWRIRVSATSSTRVSVFHQRLMAHRVSYSPSRSQPSAFPSRGPSLTARHTFVASLAADVARASHPAVFCKCIFVARLTARRRRGSMAMRLPPSADVEEDAVASPLAAKGQEVSSEPQPFFRGAAIASPSSRETVAFRPRRDLLCRPTRMRTRFRAPWPLPLAAELTSSLWPLPGSRHYGEIASPSYPASAPRASQASWHA